MLLTMAMLFDSLLANLLLISKTVKLIEEHFFYTYVFTSFICFVAAFFIFSCFRSLNFAEAGARKKYPKRTVSMVMVLTVKSRPKTYQSEHSI